MQATAIDPIATFSSIVSLALSLLSIAISLIAIWQALYMYRMSNEAASQLMQAIADLRVSAKSTEATTTQVTTRALDVLAGHFEHRVEQAEKESRMRVAESVARALAQAPPQERFEAQTAATRAVTGAFVRLKTSVTPTSGDYDWGPFIRRIADLQRNNAYLPSSGCTGRCSPMSRAFKRRCRSRSRAASSGRTTAPTRAGRAFPPFAAS